VPFPAVMVGFRPLPPVPVWMEVRVAPIAGVLATSIRVTDAATSVPSVTLTNRKLFTPWSAARYAYVMMSLAWVDMLPKLAKPAA